MTSEHVVEGMVDRLDRLERQNHRLRALLAAISVACAAGVLMGLAGPSAGSLEAREFVLRDNKGQLRGRFFLDQGDPSLEMYDQRLGQRPREPVEVPSDALAIPRVRIGLLGDASYVSLRGSGGVMTAILSGSDSGASLRLSDGKDKASAEFWVAERTGTSITLTDGNGIIRTRVDATTDGPYIKVHGTEGKVLFSAP